MKSGKKVVFIGLDAMDKDLVQTWADQGHLPTLKSLLGRNLVSPLTYQPFLEAGSVWLNTYFGCDASHHGQYDGVRYFNPETYDFSSVKSSDIALSPIWSVLSDAGKRSVVIDTPYIPLPDNHNGILVFDWLAHAPHGGGDRLNFCTHPPDLRGRIEEKYGEDPLGGRMCDYHAPRTVEELEWFRDSLLKRIEMKTEMTRDMILEEEWDLLVSVFSDSHCIGHHGWHIHDENHIDFDPAIRAAIGDPIKQIYMGLDRALGRLIEACDDSTTVLIFMSHGFEVGYTGTRLLDRILARLHGEDTPYKDLMRRTLRNAWRSVPKGLKKSLMPVRKATRNAIYHDGFLPDRHKRVCFEVFGNERAAGVRVNLKGRESQGVVEPGADYDRLCKGLIESLREVVNDETGEPLVAEVGRLQDHYSGTRVDDLPDLMVQWNRKEPIRVVSSPRIGKIRHPHTTIRTGDHRPAGLLIGLGHGVATGPRNAFVHDYEIAPTIASQFGISSEQFQGDPIRAYGQQVKKSAEV